MVQSAEQVSKKSRFWKRFWTYLGALETRSVDERQDLRIARLERELMALRERIEDVCGVRAKFVDKG